MKKNLIVVIIVLFLLCLFGCGDEITEIRNFYIVVTATPGFSNTPGPTRTPQPTATPTPLYIYRIGDLVEWEENKLIVTDFKYEENQYDSNYNDAIVNFDAYTDEIPSNGVYASPHDFILWFKLENGELLGSGGSFTPSSIRPGEWTTCEIRHKIIKISKVGSLIVDTSWNSGYSIEVIVQE